MHALIIEDEFMIAMAIEDVLRDCGFATFDIAHSMQTAIDAAAQRCPDLITADVQLTPGCGIATVRTIGPKPSTPVIFITGNAQEVRRRMPHHTVVGKPFSEQTLTYAVAAVLA
ncbi:MAG TPA: response regulator [Sphingomicrobium sp.]|nr:response regulator [Sphingomicrobium sp.]